MPECSVVAGSSLSPVHIVRQLRTRRLPAEPPRAISLKISVSEKLGSIIRPAWRYHARMEVIDYNGKGRWSSDAIRDRYREQAARLGVDEPLDLRPKVLTRGERRWIYPIMDAVISGIETGDLACCAIGVEFLEEDEKFSFGANLKYRCARALRRADLTEALAARLRRRIVAMLLAGNVPREYREYSRLLRRLGFESLWPRIDAGASRQNRYVMRYFEYFKLIHELSPAVTRQVETEPLQSG